jgi:DNA-binding phage protein
MYAPHWSLPPRVNASWSLRPQREAAFRPLRRLASAFGGISHLAEEAELNATSLYRMLSPQGNPELKSLRALLDAMGMRLAVQPKDTV